MNNLLSYYDIVAYVVDAKIRASDKNLPVLRWKQLIFRLDRAWEIILMSVSFFNRDGARSENLGGQVVNPPAPAILFASILMKIHNAHIFIRKTLSCETLWAKTLSVNWVKKTIQTECPKTSKSPCLSIETMMLSVWPLNFEVQIYYTYIKREKRNGIYCE